MATLAKERSGTLTVSAIGSLFPKAQRPMAVGALGMFIETRPHLFQVTRRGQGPGGHGEAWVRLTAGSSTQVRTTTNTTLPHGRGIGRVRCHRVRVAVRVCACVLDPPALRERGVCFAGGRCPGDGGARPRRRGPSAGAAGRGEGGKRPRVHMLHPRATRHGAWPFVFSRRSLRESRITVEVRRYSAARHGRDADELGGV